MARILDPLLWKAVPPFSKEDENDMLDSQFATIADVALRPYKYWDAFRGIVVQDYHFSNLKQGVVADMVSSCRAGWKSVDIPTLDTAAAEALVKDCSTLE
jgi:hypothetical protein